MKLCVLTALLALALCGCGGDSPSDFEMRANYLLKEGATAAAWIREGRSRAEVYPQIVKFRRALYEMRDTWPSNTKGLDDLLAANAAWSYVPLIERYREKHADRPITEEHLVSSYTDRGGNERAPLDSNTAIDDLLWVGAKHFEAANELLSPTVQ